MTSPSSSSLQSSPTSHPHPHPLTQPSRGSTTIPPLSLQTTSILPPANEQPSSSTPPSAPTPSSTSIPMATRYTHNNPQVTADPENLHPQQPFKNITNNASKYNAVPKRTKAALGDITNLAVNDQPHSQIFKPLHNNKIRRNVPSSTKLSAARLQKNSSLRKPSPMSISSMLPRRQSDRIAKRVAAAVAAASSLDCGTPMKDIDSPFASIDRFRLPSEVLDIDDQDEGNHLFVSEYACEIHRNFVEREQLYLAAPDYMKRQHDITIKMRAILIDWLVDVHLKFKLQPETLHLTVNIIDRFLELQPVLRRKLQLVGVTAMLIACKYEEIYAPEVADFVYISDRAYGKEEILAMEALILNKLQFQVTVPSTLTFMHRCLKATISMTEADNETHRFLTYYLVELTLQDSGMLAHRPSVRAAAACKLAARLCNVSLPWDDTMQFHCGGWTAEELADCEEGLYQLFDNEQDPRGTNKLTAIKRKFASHRYSGISTYMLNLAASQPIGMDICAE